MAPTDKDNVPEFLISFGDDEVTTAMNEADLQDTLKAVLTRTGATATVYKADGDAKNVGGRVDYYPLGFS